MNTAAHTLTELPDGADFTHAVSSSATRNQVSAILATYNRCPFDPEQRLRDNPLTWALDSMLAQAGDVLAEIVVVDDGSTDHTPAVLDHYRRRVSGVPIRVTGFSHHRGTAAARNAGAAAACGQWLLFGDDDCVYQPHYAAGAAYLLHRLRHTDPTVGAVMLPFYYRALRCRATLPYGRIGRLDPERAYFATGFHTWPADYAATPPRLDGTGIVAPLPVELIGGTTLVDADALAAAGGFTDVSAWRSSYSDHLHLSADLRDAGRSLFFCPDPRLAAIHLKFGALGRFDVDTTDLDTPVPALGRSLGQLVTLASVPRRDTGARVDDALFHAEMIGSFFVFFAGRSLTGGLAWAMRMWREFVEAAHVYSRTVTHTPDRYQRVAAWREGLTRGAAVVTSTAHPARSRRLLEQLLKEACSRLGQPRITGW